MWDVFISHAWEDKETVARPLAHALSQAGISVWYDEFTLTLGDSLRRSIDRGLAESRYGLVILSPDFFNKGWPQRELDGLTTREMQSGKVILPILHGLTHTDVAQYSPPLADKVSVSITVGLDSVVREILKVVRPETTLSPSKAPPQRQENRLGRIVLTIRNHPGVLAIVFLFMIIIGIGVFTDALDGIFPPYGRPRSNNSQPPRSEESQQHSDYNAGVKNMQAGKYDLAISNFSQVIIGTPNNINAYYNRGACYIQLRDYEKAIRDFGEVIKRDPSRGKAYYNRGISYKETGQKDKAIDDFKKVLELSNDTTLRQRAEYNLR